MKLRAARIALTLTMFLALDAAGSAATLLSATPPPGSAVQSATAIGADEIMARARTTAAAEHKHILVVFSASWCGPCHLFERFLENSTTGPIMAQAFVVARLDVGELPGDNRHADTPGAEKLMASLGGSQAGFPFIAMLGANGRPIVNSIRTTGGGSPGNVGYPTLPVEIDWFVHMLHEAAPSMSPQQTGTVQTWLQGHTKG